MAGNNPLGAAWRLRARIWMLPGMRVKRHYLAMFFFTVCVWLGGVQFVWAGPLVDRARLMMLSVHSVLPASWPLWLPGLALMLLGLLGLLLTIWRLNRWLLIATGVRPERAARMVYSHRNLSRGTRVVALGGGTGLSRLLTGLKTHTVNITAVVAVSDDGGSSGRLRQSLGMIAPGDLTDCYAALSDTPALRRLLLHRFDRGDGLEGHTFGNLLLATLSEQQGGVGDAMAEVHDMLNIRGRVYPASPQALTLLAELEGGEVVRGESALARERGGRAIRRLRIEPVAPPALPQVLEAVAGADLLVIGPGSLMTSLIPALLPPAVSRALRESSAPLVYVANAMTEPGETGEMTLEAHVDFLAEHLGRQPDWVLINSVPPAEGVLARYRAVGATPLTPAPDSPLHPRLISAPLLTPGTAQHDPRRVAAALLRLPGRRPVP